ncbi:Variant-specific surface protein, partial [Giardia duodenalis]
VCKVGGTLARLPLHVQGHILRLVGQIVAASDPAAHSSNDTDLHPACSGCYDTRAAPGSGVCRETRDGACVRYTEEVRAETEEQLGTGACEEVSGGGPNTCKACGAVIGGTKYCSACNDSGSEPSSGAPTDGVCTADNAVCSAKSNGVCTTCKGDSFMFKGGCYRTGQDPGQAMCKIAADGKCTSPQTGYFIPPDATKTDQSIMACNDTTEITLTNTKKYVGVANCKTCTQPTNGNADTSTAAKCTACEDGYFVNSNACKACGDENCATCAEAGNSKCSKCKMTGDKTYLKGAAGAGTCVAASGCGSGFFPKADNSAGNKCVSCSNASDGGITDCSECSLLPSVSKSSTTLISCTKCSSGNLSPLKNECMANCPAGMYADSNRVCLACHTSCASCKDDNAESSCTACYPGSVLSYGSDNTKGTCIRECTGALMAHCKAGGCTLDVGGSKYCDACEDGYAPIDGVCTAIAAGARDASGCKASGGKCTACTGANYALLSGGCYNTKALPGMSVCTAVTGGNGQCTTCANGQQPASGVCPVCPAGCSKCSGSGSSQICSECLAGYYLSGTTCVKCDKNSTDNKITGVENCVSCNPPSSNQGSVTCYVTQEPSVNPTDPSTNKTGLSSGAIAGISVAVIAVVGGLVGFLCWWFLCRGKA